MKFKADEISSVIQREIEQFQAEVTRTEVGRVLEVGDGIAGPRPLGRDDRRDGRVRERRPGNAFNLEESSVGVIVLGDYTTIHEGETVTATGPAARARRRRPGRPRGQPPGRADRQPGADLTGIPAGRSIAPGSPAGSRSTSRCRPASRRSTP